MRAAFNKVRITIRKTTELQKHQPLIYSFIFSKMASVVNDTYIVALTVFCCSCWIKNAIIVLIFKISWNVGWFVSYVFVFCWGAMQAISHMYKCQRQLCRSINQALFLLQLLPYRYGGVFCYQMFLRAMLLGPSALWAWTKFQFKIQDSRTLYLSLEVN